MGQKMVNVCLSGQKRFCYYGLVRATNYFRPSLLRTFLVATAVAVNIFFFSAHPAQAATRIWDGEGTDETCGGEPGDGNRWSCDLNWSDDTVPTNSDSVTFNDTSTKDAVVDSAFGGGVASMLVSPVYTGTITLERSLTVSTTVIVQNGVFDTGSWALSVDNEITVMNLAEVTCGSGGVWNIGNSFFMVDGTADLADCELMTTALAQEAGTLTLGDDSAVNGTLTLNGGTFNAPSGTLLLGGNLTTEPSATFNANSGTINLAGTNQILHTDATFYNLYKVITVADTLKFFATSTISVEGELTFQGASGQLLSLLSTTEGQVWGIDPTGTTNLAYLYVQDSQNLNGTTLSPANSVNGGNTVGWFAVPPSPSPTPSPTPPGPAPSSTSTASPASASPSGCSDLPPGAKAPWIYAALPTAPNAVMLYFAEGDNPIDHYVLEYGLASGNYIFGSGNIGPQGTRTYLVQSLAPGTTYYFRIRGGNGCAAGGWSNEFSARPGAGAGRSIAPTVGTRTTITTQPAPFLATPTSEPATVGAPPVANTPQPLPSPGAAVPPAPPSLWGQVGQFIRGLFGR